MSHNANANANAIAVVGMGCRFPGADSVDEYWRILETGKSMLSEPPKGRFPTTEHQRSTGKTVYYGNYLDSISRFDNRFFKKSSREAASMDPQQRLLLEVSYQALESSGFFGPREPDLDVGCFIGVCASDYNDNVASHPSNAFSALGTLRAFVPGRVSHFFGLTGPSIALDTACSSSAVAIDAACKAILHGDCRSAIAGGVSVFTSPFFYQNLSAASFLSSTGASKSFDASADGYCRGEGIGLVVLKRLSDAVACGDNILGTILSTAVRQSSNQVPITVPYSPSQTDLYRKLLSTAGITPETVTYVEAHGTGTPVGDPLEFGAIKEVFGIESRTDPLYFASVKGNIGHTEGASGVAGLIKTILMMQNHAIPRQAHFKSAHANLSLVPGQISIPTETVGWNAKDLVACVNNYGAAGSIAAILVKQPPSQGVSIATSSVISKRPLVITANSAKSLGENCAKLADYVSSVKGQSASDTNLLADITFNLSDRQNRTLPNMFATAVSSLSELDSQLRTVASNPDLAIRQVNPKSKPVVLVFGGQSSRSVGLSKSVYKSSKLLRKYLDECNDILKEFGHSGIYPDIFDPAPVDDVVSLQTMQFALHYACAQSWIACGLKIDCVLGHSFGQLVALTVSGVLSLIDGLRLVYGRAVHMREIWGPERGSMLAIEADRETTIDIISSARKMTSPSGSGIEVACFNGPTSHVLVGSAAEVDAAVQATKTSNAKARVLDVTHGFHSRFCDPIIPELERLAHGLTLNKPTIPLESCSAGESWPEVTANLIADHTRTPVYFGDAVKRIGARFGACTWLEAGSNSSITSIVRRALPNHKDHLFFPVNLTRDDSMSALADTAVNLCKNGTHVQYWPFHHIQRQEYRPLNLPPYQFEKNEHWLEFDLQAGTGSEPTSMASKGSQPVIAEPEPEPEPVLFEFCDLQDIGNGQKQATFAIDPRSEEWRVLVAGHSVLHESLCPATLYIELVLRAAKGLANIKNMSSTPFARVDDLEISSPLGMSQEKMVHLVFTPSDAAGRKFNFTFLSQNRSGKPAALQTHATGTCETAPEDDTTVFAELERTRKLLKHIHKGQDHAQRFADMASQLGGEAVYGSIVYKVFSRVVQYHDFYQGVRKLASTSDGSVAAEVYLPETQPGFSKDLLSLPVAIDNFFQVPGLFANCLAPCPSDEVFVSTHVDRIQLSPEFGKQQAEGSSCGWEVFTMSTSISDKESSNDIFVTDRGTGKLVFVAFGAKFSRVKTATLARILSRANPKATSAPAQTEVPQRGPVPAIQAISKPVAVRPSQLPQSIQAQQPTQQKTAPQIEAVPAKSIPSSPPPVIQARPQLPSVEKELRQMLSKITDVPANEFQTNVALDQLGIDSLMATEMVSEIRQAFNISIPQSELAGLETFGSLCSYLDGHESRQWSVHALDQPSQAKLAPVQSAPTITSIPEKITIPEIKIQEQTTSEIGASDVPDYEQQEELVAQLAGLLGTHLECPATDFERPTNLADRGLDSLLSMELMSDIDGMFGVSIDPSLILGESTFGHLADILVSSVISLRPAGSTDSSTVPSTRALSPGIVTPGIATPGTIPDDIVDGGGTLTTATKVQSASTTGVLGSAAQAFETIKGDFDKFAEKYRFGDFYTKVADKQAELVLAYVVEAMADLGVDLRTLRPGDRISRIQVAPKHERMTNVFNEVLRAGKLADYDGKEYVRSDVSVDATPSSVLHKDIIERFPQHAKEHTLLNLCGSDMSKLLTGKMDPLAVLFGSKANKEILEDVYTTAPMFVVHSELLTNYLEKALSSSSPGPDGKFHIVELGAGTGATTRWIVDRLVQCGIPIEYTFTDISSSLVAGSKRKFANYDCMKYGTIDIEKEPPAEYQGQFDIVLATNCIHATSNLRNSMGNINKLLRPHGFVSLVELTTRNYWLDMVFGLLDGWWLYDDGRPYVLATPEFWDKTMRQVGFKHVSWTGGHTRESEVVRVITGFKQPVTDPSSYRSMPQEKTENIETVVFAHTDKKLPLRANIHYPSSAQEARYDTWVTGTV